MTETLTYSQTHGTFSDAGEVIARGWAGRGLGKNNPAMEDAHCIGPLPKGVYTIGPWEAQHGRLGTLVAPLIQVSGETFGRSAFFIHGPASDPEHYGQESMGCTVVPRADRLKIKLSGATFLEVIL
jgi:hypothetical protein